MGKDQELVQAVKEQDALAVEKILAKSRNSKSKWPTCLLYRSCEDTVSH